MNLAILAGTITRPLELRTSAKGTPWGWLLLDTGDGQRHRCTLFHARGERSVQCPARAVGQALATGRPRRPRRRGLRRWSASDTCDALETPAPRPLRLPVGSPAPAPRQRLDAASERLGAALGTMPGRTPPLTRWVAPRR